MAQADIVFIEGQGGLGRPLTGEDFISGLLYYTADGNLPSGFTTTSRVKALYSVNDAINAGIKNDYSDAVQAIFITSLTRGNTGDKITIKYTGINGVVLDLGTYTQSSTDTTLALLGASIASFINAKTYLHGCTAQWSSPDLAIFIPKNQGIFPNTGTPLAITVTGDLDYTTPSLDTAGEASKLAIWHYHIAEYFRKQPKGRLFVGFYAVPTTYDFTEITLIQTFAQGKIRQIGIYLGGECHAFTSADLTAIDLEIKTNNDAVHKELSALYAADLSETSDLTTLTDLNTLTANKVTAIVSQDGAGLGDFLWKGTGKSIATLGAHLGAVAFAAVSDSIMWVDKFNMSNGTELDTPAFANGVLLTTVTQNYIDTLDSLKYVFLVQYVGRTGSYTNHSYTAIASTSDYSRIENNRTIDKARRGVYLGLIGDLGSPLVLNSDGTLKDTTIAVLSSDAELNLTQMVRDGELSAVSVLIDPTQNVLSTGKLYVTVNLLPIGVAEAIQVNIGFVTSI